ncbi:hypothetical protein EXIGLDRAFT_57071 [Exidia glandulosa HHB12029]|uniref:Uncharacterized protein n=1 Tax=Exidia glandulosa HHB12029 TaxID=1314781 RepID=A0A165I7X3_EXIGL|nr:hypothetical protein EXIGLDRAFT_57071 [Exidia glandulosa HHB12029]
MGTTIQPRRSRSSIHPSIHPPFVYTPLQIANAMFAIVWPMLLIQTLLLIVATVVYFAPIDNDLSVYCAMIPWRVQQIAIVCVLAWVIRTRPLNVDGTQSPASKQLTSQINVS